MGCSKTDNIMSYTVVNNCPKVFTVCNVLLCGIIDEEMKYLDTVNLGAGVVTDITTTLTTEPYNIFVLDSAGNELGDPEIAVSLALVGGVYHVYIFTAVALNNVKVKILY